MQTFREMGLRPATLKSLDAMQITVPTAIQAQTIPLALEGKDVIGSAQTAGGKTLSFAIPVLEGVLKNPASEAGLLGTPAGTALILVPTRELAVQVATVFRDLVKYHSEIKLAVLIGGEDIFKQLRQLKNGPRIIVGTPGRVIDHLQRGSYNPRPCKFLVLDEADRMVDMGFGPQIDEIISRISRERQTLMFTATLDAAIERVAGDYMRNPERVVVGKTSTPAPTIQQEIMQVSDFKKYDTLVEQLDGREGSIIVFVNTQVTADRLVDKLSDGTSHNAIAIHGGLRQSKRDRVLASFRAGKSRVMVATDVAARGLDIPRIQHVINYDVPLCPEDYIHRIGRTSRAGDVGCAVCLVSPRDDRKWYVIDRFMRQSSGGKPTNAKVTSLREPRVEGAARTFDGAAGEGRSGERRSSERRSSFGDREGGRRRSFGSSEGGYRRKSFDRGSSEQGSNDRGDRKPFGSSDRGSFDRGSSEGGYARKSFGSSEGYRGKSAEFGGERRSFERRKPFGSSGRGSFDRGSSEGYRPKPTEVDGEGRAGEGRKPFVFSSSPRRSFGSDRSDDRRGGEHRTGERRSGGFGGERRSFGSGEGRTGESRFGKPRGEHAADSAEPRRSKNFFPGPRGGKKRFEHGGAKRQESGSFARPNDAE
jgi:ATP-dependent RNA helicase DeaD